MAQTSSSDPSEVASEAAEVVDRHCSDVASSATSQAAEAFTEVSAVWARVSRSHDKHGTTFLLYWRGVLSQCLNQVERAREDLSAFVAAVADDPTYSSQVSNATRRLRLLDGGGRSSAPAAARGEQQGVGLVLAIGGAGAAAAGLGMHFGAYEAGGLEEGSAGLQSRQDPDTYSTLRGVNIAGFGLAVGAGVASAVGIAVAASARDSKGLVLVPVVSPGRHALVVGLGGAW